MGVETGGKILTADKFQSQSPRETAGDDAVVDNHIQELQRKIKNLRHWNEVTLAARFLVKSMLS